MTKTAANSVLLVLLVLAFGLGAPQPASAELQEWDQKQVTSLAVDLLTASQAFQGALRREPPRTLGQPGRRAFWTLRDEMQGIVAAARRFHSMLEGGSGQEETYPVYRRILRNARRAARETRRLDLGGQLPAKIEAIAQALRSLRPFYDAEPPI